MIELLDEEAAAGLEGVYHVAQGSFVRGQVAQEQAAVNEVVGVGLSGPRV